MRTKAVTKKEYTIILTRKEAEILCNALESIPRSSLSKKTKASKELQERINFTDNLFDNVYDLLESEDD